jgi:hypothetical protein
LASREQNNKDVQCLEEMLSKNVKEELETKKLELLRIWETTISLTLLFYFVKNIQNKMFHTKAQWVVHILFTTLHILLSALSYKEGYLKTAILASFVLYFRQIYVLCEEPGLLVEQLHELS